MCVYTTTAIRIYSASLFYPYMQIPFLPADFPGDKIVAFDFSDAHLFHPVIILTIKIF